MNPYPTIAFVIPHGVQLFYPGLIHKQGGAEVQIALLVRELARRRVLRPVVLLGRYGQPLRDTFDDIQFESFAHRAGLPGRLSLWRALLRTRAAAAVQRASGSMTANVAFYSLLTGLPFIYWVASDFDCFPTAHPDLDYPPRNRLFDWGLRRAAAIVAQHAGQAGLLERNVGHGPAAIIPNGWPAEPQVLPPQSERHHHLWIGHATRHKNPAALLDLAAAFPHERFVMVMPPDRGHAAIAAEVTVRLASLPNVELRPRVPFAEMRDLYAQSKTLIMTSLAEGFPNTMLQALWNGVPVLSLFIDPGDMLTKNEIGFCTQGDAAALAAAFGKLNANPEAWEAMSRRAYAYASAELSIGHVADLFTNLLRQLKLMP